VIDVGSNTMRLLVASPRGGSVERVAEAKAYLALGAEIVRTGAIGPAKLAEATLAARRFAAIARELGVAAVDVLVTAPGRQAANADELVAGLSRATGLPVRVLTGEEEGVLAYEGARATTAVDDEPAAVCDVGGGSTEITVGDGGRGLFWSRSLDVGALRLTASVLHDDPPARKQIASARALVAEQLAAMPVPEIGAAVVVGGSARAVARLYGRPLDDASLERALASLALRPSAELARTSGIDGRRAATLAGGAIILLELARRLRHPLLLAEGGLREGSAARLLAAAKAA
jgi:exopolyphosphatase/guanosine-5'-triphosphate,3'-diphosphate pyrophosphatase